MPTDRELTDAWTRIRADLRATVSDGTWRLWLAPVRPRDLRAGHLELEAPNEVRSWVERRFGRLLHVCAARVLGSGIKVSLVAPGSPSTAPPSRDAPATPAFAVAPNPRFTFEQFVIGDANRLAHAAALAVAELPGLAYNPLFICGPPGLGKTHLLHSIANYVGTYGDGGPVRYTTGEAFTNEFLGALQSGGLRAFKSAYRHAGVLLIDDVQFLQRKARTEEEFFHTFNALHEAGAQLVLTSDRLPRDLEALADRLRERFEAGLVCDVRPPDSATRLTILRKRVEQDGLRDIEPAALVEIADRVDTNIRALEGALIRVVAYASLTRQAVTADVARQVLDGLYPRRRSAPRSVRDIQERVCAAFGVTLEDLVSPNRRASVTWPRQVAMYLARELTDATLPAIGREFGGRNHATVLHAHRRTAERIAADPEAFAAVRRLSAALRDGE